jgi:hypothetical protein
MANGITRYYPQPKVVQLIFGQLLCIVVFHIELCPIHGKTLLEAPYTWLHVTEGTASVHNRLSDSDIFLCRVLGALTQLLALRRQVSLDALKWVDFSLQNTSEAMSS